MSEQAPLSFWSRPGVQRFFPLATSLALHAGIVALGFLIMAAVNVVRQVTREQVIIPDTNLVENADNGGVPNPGINDDPTRAAAQASDETAADSREWGAQKSPTLASNLMAGSADVAQEITPIGAGAATGGTVNGLTRRGSGEGGGNLAPFGPPGGGAGQGKGLFGIPGGNVRRVVYVCDASGSLFGTRALALIQNEMRESVSRLRPTQAFNVIFFRGSETPPILLNDHQGLQLATPKVKEAAYKMIEGIDLRGSTDPRKALDLAFKMTPDMVFLLIDGVASTVMTPEDLQNHIAQLNVAKKVKLTVIVVGDASEVELAPFKTLATQNGGDLRRVTER